MKIAFVADIHGNISAFEEFLLDVERNKIDAFFVTVEFISKKMLFL